MFRHVAMWKFNDGYTPGQIRENAIHIKAGLEELAYEVHGVISIDVHIDPVRVGDDDGNEWDADLMVDACFANREAFRVYLDHRRHAAVEELIDECAEKCLAMDFEDREEEEDFII